MKSTGIVRRIDDLGRIVIPKEIRRSLNIVEGDPMELYVEDGAVIFKRYCPDGLLRDEIRSMKASIESEWLDSAVSEALLKHVRAMQDILDGKKVE